MSGMICEGLLQAACRGQSPLLVSGSPHHVPILTYALSAGDSLSGGLARQHNSLSSTAVNFAHLFPQAVEQTFLMHFCC